MFTGSFLILLKLQIKEKISRSEATLFLLFSRTRLQVHVRTVCLFFSPVMSAVLQEAKAVISVYKTPRKRCALEEAAGRGEGRRIITTLRWGEERGEGFKINVIFLDPLHPSSPPCFLSFLFFGSAQWACFILFCQTQGGHREELKWRRTERRGEALLQGEQWNCYWERFNAMVLTKKKSLAHEQS